MLEIKELHIKATVSNQNQNAGNAPEGQADSAEKEKIVQACIEKVLEILRDKEMR